MNRVILLVAGLCLGLTGFAQNDSSRMQMNGDSGRLSKGTALNDTLHVGNFLILRNGVPDKGASDHTWSRHHHDRVYKPSNITTSWFSFDLGFTNYNDRTNYASAGAQQFAPGSTKDWFALKSGKSVDVNIWFFTQRVNLIKHVVNLKWGLGLELNNYRYEDNIRFHTKPTQVIMDTISYGKDKLAADFITVPLMLNFNLSPHRQHDFGFSAGASIGYKYSSRQKFKSGETGKEKTYDGFDLDPWKISWVGELRLGIINFYGSYDTKSMFKKGLDQVPYTIGLRFDHF